jgi:pimeloyl-ACP methyl ester carboxylesterase
MRRLADRLGAEFRLLPGRPHAPWMEDPDGAVLSLAEEFMLRAEKDA